MIFLRTEISLQCHPSHLSKWKLLFMECKVAINQGAFTATDKVSSQVQQFPEKAIALRKQGPNFSMNFCCIQLHVYNHGFQNPWNLKLLFGDFFFYKHKKLWNYIVLLSLLVSMLLALNFVYFTNRYKISMCWLSTLFSLTHQNLVLLPKTTLCWWLNLLLPADHFLSFVLHLKQETDKTVLIFFTRHMFSCSKQF